MAAVVITGDTSGSVTLQAPAVAGTTTLTLPSTSGTVLTTASTTGISGSAISSGTVAEAYGGTGTTTGYYGFKNRIINGAMMIDQRNAGASVTPADGAYTLDRWQTQTVAASGVYTVQRSTVAPSGFTNSLLATVTTVDSSLSSGDYYYIRQKIEGFNTADFGFGAAGAATVTLSFKVRSSITGTFGGSLANSAFNRSYPFTYTVNSANTWEDKQVTIAGDTSGTWLTDNGIGISVFFSLGAGSNFSGTAGAWEAAGRLSATGATNLMATNGATFYITGVQLEKGSTATSFDYRPYGTELALCQRYFQKSYSTETAVATNTTSGAVFAEVLADGVTTRLKMFGPRLMVPMRASPTVTGYTQTGTSGSVNQYNNNATTIGISAFNGTNTASIGSYLSLSSSASTSNTYEFHYTAVAEL